MNGLAFLSGGGILSVLHSAVFYFKSPFFFLLSLVLVENSQDSNIKIQASECRSFLNVISITNYKCWQQYLDFF